MPPGNNDERMRSDKADDPRSVTFGQFIKQSPRFFWWLAAFALAFLMLAAFAGLSWKSAQELSRQLNQMRSTGQAPTGPPEGTQAAIPKVGQELEAARARELILQAQLAEEDGYPERSLLLTVALGRASGQAPTLEVQQALLDRLNRIGGMVLPGNQGSPGRLGFSPDGHWLVSDSRGSAAELWDMHADVPSNSPIILGGHTDRIIAMAFSHDSHWLATGSADQTVRLWDLTASQPFPGPIVLQGHEKGVSALAFSPDDKWLVTSSYADVTYLWDMQTIKQAASPVPLSRTSRPNDMWITDLVVSSDGRWLAAADFDSYIYVWDLRTAGQGSDATELVGELWYEVRSLDFSPDGRWLVSGSADGTIRRWDMHSPDPQSSMTVMVEKAGNVPLAHFSRNGLWLSVTDRDGFGSSRLLQLDSGGSKVGEALLVGQAGASAFSSDDHWLATSSKDHSIRIWDLGAPGLNQYYDLKGHDDDVTALAFSPDGHWLASGGDDQTVRLWNMLSVASPANPARAPLEPQVLKALVLSPDGSWLAYVSQEAPYPSAEPTIELRKLNSGSPDTRPLELHGPTGEVSWGTFSVHDHWLSASSRDGTVWVWNLQAKDPTQAMKLPGHLVDVVAMAFSQDERWLITGSLDLTTRVWDLQSADPASSSVTLRGHQGGITALAISPDNHWLATGSLDSNVRIWDLSSKDPNSSSTVLDEFGTQVSALAYSPGGHWLASASQDGRVHLRDLRNSSSSARPITLNGNVSSICCLIFSPDDRWLVTGPTAQLWDLSSVQPDTQALTPYRALGDAYAIQFSADGNWLALAESSGIQLINTQSPDLNGSLVLNEKNTTTDTLAFGPDGRILVSTAGSVVSTWRFSWDDLSAQACQTAGRNFSQLEWKQYFPDESYRITCPEWPAGE